MWSSARGRASSSSATRSTSPATATSSSSNAASARSRIAAWCLLPDHVHLLLSPQTHEGLARVVGETHRLYARHRDLGANALWAGRFRSCPVAPGLEAACAAYIESNPARLGLDAWAWASTAPTPHAPGSPPSISSVPPPAPAGPLDPLTSSPRSSMRPAVASCRVAAAANRNGKSASSACHAHRIGFNESILKESDHVDHLNRSQDWRARLSPRAQTGKARNPGHQAARQSARSGTCLFAGCRRRLGSDPR